MRRPRTIAVAVAVVASLGLLPATGVAQAALPAPPLRDLADQRGLRIGSAVADGPLGTEADYARVLGEQFNLVEPENAMKWDAIHPEVDRYDFAAADRIVAFARAHDQVVRGHTLAWHSQNPAWLTSATYTRSQAIEVLRDHISTVVGHYRGQVAQWDVVNEALPESGPGLRATPWSRWIGDDYLELAFRFAHEADPDAKLFYNDYDVSSVGEKSRRIVALAARLKASGVPIDGVGLQFHVYGAVDAASVRDVFAAAGRAGLEVAVTELDVSLRLPADASARSDQADRFATVLRACLAAPTCHTVNLWGFTDRHSWIPAVLPGLGAATPLDEGLSPKPAWRALRQTLTEPAAPPTSTTASTSPSPTTSTSAPGDPDPPAGEAAPAAPVRGGRPTYTG